MALPRAGAALSLLVIAACAHAQLAAVARAECLAGHSPADGRACLESKAQEAAAALRQASTDFESALLAWQEDAEYARAAKEAEAAAALSYGRYRQSTCDAAASLGAAGNRQQDFRLSCEYEADSERAAQVREATLLLRAKSKAASAPGQAASR